MRSITAVLLLFAATINSYGFCGFYVAKADASLFNDASQVIITRNGENSTITMSSDYKGDLKEFALVIPVPVVLQESDIRIANPLIFQKLDAYSAPRMAEYYDQNPCYIYQYDMAPVLEESTDMVEKTEDAEPTRSKTLGVKIEAEYTVGEYDILILSAKQSDGLKIWLNENGYKIPETANEVLDPYIKGGMKFFVAKVNLKKQKNTGFQTLRPIQVSFNSNRFMLPLRLGMANSQGTQDMIVYAFSEKGRVEATNYRTTKLPTDMNVPLFVRDDFNEFYKSVFERSWKLEGKNVVMLEYAWDLSPMNYVQCDPCAGDPPVVADLVEAGVNWLEYNPKYNINDGQVFFTRLHVRYDREHFPQDLFFQETPNREYFQGRYVIHHPVEGQLDCDGAQEYYKTVFNRRQKELMNLAQVTGWNINSYAGYLDEYADKAGVKKVKQNSLLPADFNRDNEDVYALLTILLMGGVCFSVIRLMKTIK